jgi:predicted peroxiredoxin
MATYLLIESRDPFESNDVGYYYELSRALAAAGNEVTVFLVQNGVMVARRTGKSDGFLALTKSGVRIVADDFSLKERGIVNLADGVSAGPIDLVVDALAAGHKTLWH